MEINEDIELDIENKYMNKVVFTLEESIYILKRKNFCDEVEDMAIDRLTKYIKEESVPKAKIEMKIHDIDNWLDGRKYVHYGLDPYKLTAQKEVLQKILNKGEKDG